MIKKTLFVCVVILVGVVQGTSIDNQQKSKRQPKLFNLQLLPFVTINVDPTPCSANNGGNGTCHSEKSCKDKGGTANGTCADGYGVCCLFEQQCGAVVKRNDSYLVNEGYPNAYSDVGNCQYIVEKMNPNICQLRLDMEIMELAGPSSVTSMCEEDTFTIVGTAGENPRVICGKNTGQHMYLDLASGTATARVNIATTTKSTDRKWKIKVTQIECDSTLRAPPHCLQYYTAYSGSIKSFNYQPTQNELHQIGGQSYTVCIKTREGFCGITYSSTSFSVSGNATEDAVAVSGDASCTGDFLSIFTVGKTSIIGEDRYCGTGFTDTTTYSKPFEIRVISDETEPTEDVDNVGFDLKYMQIPC